MVLLDTAATGLSITNKGTSAAAFTYQLIVMQFVFLLNQAPNIGLGSYAYCRWSFKSDMEMGPTAIAEPPWLVHRFIGS